MLARQRHDVIVDAIRQQGSVRVRELAALLSVSEMTVRRDLDVLANRNLVDKVHGGATRVGDLSGYEPGFAAKQRRQRAEKVAITTRACEFIRPGSSIGLTAGTTTWLMAKALIDLPDVTVVTNAPSIAQALYRHRPEGSVVLTGGTRTRSDALVGPLATGALGQLHLDTVFMGVHGMDLELGYSTPNLVEAEVNRAFIHAARRVIVVADHTKWGTRGLAQIAPLARADIVVSDDQLPAAAEGAFAEIETELHLVPTAVDA